jgi:AcrR family transcriptional regulator
MANPADDLSETMRLLWSDAGPARRGPKPKLTVVKIAEAGITVADGEGLEAVSMQRVAAELGFTTMSIYTYIPSKEHLLEVMIDVATGEPPVLAGHDWRERVESWVLAVQRLFAARPWMLRIPVRTPPMGPRQLAWFDRLLGAMNQSGLGTGEALEVSMYLLAACRETARIYNDQDPALSMDGYGAAMLSALTPERFPALHDAASQGAFREDRLSAPSLHGFGLRRLLDGVSDHVAKRTA